MKLEPVLSHFYSTSQWSLAETGDDTAANYASLQWGGPGPKPTRAQLEAQAATMPSAAVRQAAKDRAEIKAALLLDDPIPRGIRALLQITKPAAITMQVWRQRWLDAIDANA